MAKLAFPNGAAGLLDYWAESCDQAMAVAAQKADLDKMRLSERIAFLVRIRIEQDAAHREAAKTAVAYLAVPLYHGQAMRLTSRTVDLMWKLAGDHSTDFNYYTKRLSLGALYSATFFYWLSDESENYADSWAFLDRRIADLLNFEKTKSKVRSSLDKLPSLTEMLGKWRYGTSSTKENSPIKDTEPSPTASEDTADVIKDVTK